MCARYILYAFVLSFGFVLAQTNGTFIYVNNNSDTSYVPFMYINGDTLDYCCGGTGTTGVMIDSLIYNSHKKVYTVYGKMYDKNSGESFGSIGDIILGQIKLVRAKTWIGDVETGILQRISSQKTFGNGEFRIEVAENFEQSIIFTLIGYTIVEVPFRRLKVAVPN